jgi:D-3-phosphoglycerate dehydrogenase
MKIVLAEKTAPAAVNILREQPEWNVLTAEQLNGDLAAQLADADALVVRSAVQVTPELLQNAKKLRVIGRAGVGVDNINLDAATRKGIVVMNTPGANAVAVAEETFALMLALARHLVRADVTTRAGKWEKKSLQGTELRGKTLGIVGLGRIGMEVARRAAAFQMKLMAHDPFVSQSVARDLNVTLASLDEVFAAADYLSLHVGLTPETQGMINAQNIAKMKKGVRIINCARGELIHDAELAAAITSGHVGGAALDVFTVEPPKDNPLLKLENVIATPHIAGSTNEAQDAVGIQIAQQVREYLARGVIQNAVNVPAINDEEYAEMQPYIALAEKLGSFVAQLSEGNAEEIQVRYSGRIASWKTTLIRNAALKGVLDRFSPDQANLVNAAALAQERGVRVEEARKPEAAGPVANVISLDLLTSAGEHNVVGGVLRGAPRLLELDGITIEAPLEGQLIYVHNRDVPGVVGRLGTVLGEHNVNIANFSLGRAWTGEPRTAVAVIQVDSAPPAPAIEAIRKMDAVTSAKSLRV